MAMSQVELRDFQKSINRLLSARNRLFSRKPGDSHVIEDFLFGHQAILSTLQCLHKYQNVRPPGKSLKDLIEGVWRVYRLGPTLGTGMACQKILRFIDESAVDEPRLKWKGWLRLQW